MHIPLKLKDQLSPKITYVQNTTLSNKDHLLIKTTLSSKTSPKDHLKYNYKDQF